MCHITLGKPRGRGKSTVWRSDWVQVWVGYTLDEWPWQHVPRFPAFQFICWRCGINDWVCLLEWHHCKLSTRGNKSRYWGFDSCLFLAMSLFSSHSYPSCSLEGDHGVTSQPFFTFHRAAQESNTIRAVITSHLDHSKTSYLGFPGLPLFPTVHSPWSHHSDLLKCFKMRSCYSSAENTLRFARTHSSGSWSPAEFTRLCKPLPPPAFLTLPPATPSTSKFQACLSSFHFSHTPGSFITHLMAFAHSVPPSRRALPWVLHVESSSSPSQFHVTSPEKPSSLALRTLSPECLTFLALP